MKKALIFIFSAFVLSSCNKTTENDLQGTNQFVSYKGGKGGLPGLTFTVEFRAGHSPQTPPCCGNYPLCVSPPFNCGFLLHTPCTGSGSNCGWTIGIGGCDTENNGGSQEVLAIFSKSAYDEIVFNFPAFSYDIGNGKYINVPEQLAEKGEYATEEEVSYTLQNVTITSAPVY